AVSGRAAQALQDAAAAGLPETGGIQQFDHEEEPVGLLHPFAYLSEQVGLARARRAAHHHSERRGLLFPAGVAEGLHHLIERAVVEAGHVQRALRIPQVVCGGRPRQPQRAQGLTLSGIHQFSIAIRCLAWSPISTAAARSSAVKVFWFSSGIRLTPGVRYIRVSAASSSGLVTSGSSARSRT